MNKIEISNHTFRWYDFVIYFFLICRKTRYESMWHSDGLLRLTSKSRFPAVWAAFLDIHNLSYYLLTICFTYKWFLNVALCNCVLISTRYCHIRPVYLCDNVKESERAYDIWNNDLLYFQWMNKRRCLATVSLIP